MTVASIALFAVVICACGGSSASGTSKKESRSPGEVTFRANCQTCHSLPRPASKTDEQWPALVQKYGQRAKLRPEQIQQIIAFLTAAN